MNHHRSIPLTFLAFALLAGFAASPVNAQDDNAPDAAGPSDIDGQEEQPLHILEQALLRDYERFEEKLLELAEYTRRNDPDRAELLVRTRSESTSRRIEAQMKRIADALAPSESGDVLYGDALARQEELIADLKHLLKLLQSEDERDRIDRDIAWFEELKKDAERLIGEQKDVRSDTERGGDPSKLSGDQQGVNEDAEALAEKIDRRDAERKAEDDQKSGQSGPPQEGETQDGMPQEGEPSEPGENADSPDGKQPDEKSDDPKDNEPKEGEQPTDPKEGESKPGEPQDGKPSDGRPSDGKPSDGKPQDGKPQEGQPQEGQPQEGQPQEGQPGEQQESPSQQSPGQQTPGREQLEEARERMEKAIEELKLERLDKASGEQDAALAKLEEMKAQLEEILRQLREEEKKLFLMALEARFQRMLERQLNINNETLKLDRVPADERDEDRHIAEATRQSRVEGDNMTDAEKTLLLLREDGSSVAFPEAVEMMRDNMQAVVGRLQRGETGETTQLIERMIVESLEEIVFALQREMEKQDEKQGEPQQGEPTDPSLVDKLAELKMIRSLQSQVNRLTRQYGLEIDGEQATTPDDLTFLRNLAGRQERIQEATYDLSIGKNK